MSDDSEEKSKKEEFAAKFMESEKLEGKLILVKIKKIIDNVGYDLNKIKDIFNYILYLFLHLYNLN